MRSTIWLVLALLAIPVTARATFHDVKIVEVYTGPGPQYVMLQSYTAGQDLLTNHSLLVYDASGQVVQTNTFGNPDFVSSLPNQGAILIGTSNVAGTFFVTVDLDMPAPAMSAAGGKVCWDATLIDCVAWGSYTGSSTGVGSPAVPSGIPSGKAIRRDRSISGGANTLEATDDTDNSAADFDVADPMPRNSLGNVGSSSTTLVGGTTTTGPTTTTIFGATTSSTATTTTTLDCAPFGIAAAQCVLDAVPPAACGGETFARKLERTIASAEALLGRALLAEGTRRGPRLVRRAAARLEKASRLAASAGTRGKITSECATALSALLTDARGRLVPILPN